MECTDTTAWNRFLTHGEHSQFLQSWEWGEFQKNIGRPVVRLCQKAESSISSAAQLVSIPLILNTEYWYAPRGPVAPSKEFIGEIIAHCKKTSGLFFRFDPLTADDLALAASTPFCVQKSPEIQPSHSYTVDLSSPEAELLSRMREKTRYNIRLSERKGVSVTAIPAHEATEREMREFIELMQTTAGRNKFSAHPSWYYRRLFSSFSASQAESPEKARLSLYRAVYQGDVLAAGLMLLFGDTVNYVHGASSSIHRECMAPYAMHWRAMRDAKMAGYRYYDFGGVGPDDEPNHPLAGVTQFKKGFAGSTLRYPGTYDLVLRPHLYAGYRVLRGIWRRSRMR